MVGKSDFNENPVVSPDLDLDLDLGFVNLRKVLVSNNAQNTEFLALAYRNSSILFQFHRFTKIKN